MRQLFGTDGVRGIAYEFLTAELAKNIGLALGTVLLKDVREPKVLIGTDTRISKDMLDDAISEGLSEMGCDSVRVRVVPTPAVAYIVKNFGFDAGVMISASHNPYEYNGIKIFAGSGFKLSDELEETIEDIIFSSSYAKPERIGAITEDLTLVDKYVDYIASTVSPDLSGIKVAFDCANGSASSTAMKLFSRFGIEATYLSYEPDGKNINTNCGSTHIENLAAFVKENGYDIGIAFDGDADRCLTVDETGREIDGDYIMAILATDMKKNERLRKNTVVGTIMSNVGFAKYCEENGLNFVATKVGDRYVLEEMEAKGYALGGEQSGHVILRDYATTGDGQLTALHILDTLYRSGGKYSELASVMKKYPQHLVNVKATDAQKKAFSTDEGIKAIIDETNEILSRKESSGRLVIRPSGTEPVVRIMIECVSEELTVSICENAADRIKAILSKY
ncbi:MAG: phosphoglucosamine mutase [Clostridia bacterium]|nr:phosphoglucosamine mutase [Clostridia bacterium]